MNGNYKLIEINAFSTCGLYQCDLTPIINFIDKNLEKEYIAKDINVDLEII